LLLTKTNFQQIEVAADWKLPEKKVNGGQSFSQLGITGTSLAAAAAVVLLLTRTHSDTHVEEKRDRAVRASCWQ